MRQQFYSSYKFCLDYFQNIMDLDGDHIRWKPRQRAKHILELCEYYRVCFHFDRSYKSSEVWNLIKKKYYKWFDDLLGDVIK